jgi:hypothetical protein
VEFTEIKQHVLRQVVRHGWNNPKQIPKELIEGVPEAVVHKWMEKFYRTMPIEAIPSTPKLVNRFTMGADPEMTFMHGGILLPAQKMAGFATGLAFGMDMNGRLAELRPIPSRFALDIVASILVELRWMATLCPDTLAYEWLARPFDGQDGVGGHIHLARKRNMMSMGYDLDALAYVQTALMNVGAFNKTLIDSRRTHTKYGSNNDFRLQRHGYEFRAFPTWLDTPWQAYLALVLSKLALFDTGLFQRMMEQTQNNARMCEKGLVNFLAYYKSRDDDAWIAYHAYKKHGMPKYYGGDFKAAWGILYPRKEGAKRDTRFFPEMIEPTENERQAIFDYLVKGQAIPPTVPVQNWKPDALPKGYEWAMNHTTTYHKVGIGEILATMAVAAQDPFKVVAGDSNREIVLSCLPQLPDLSKGLAELASIKGSHVKIVKELHTMLYLPIELRTFDTIPKVKKILVSGHFPMWNVNEVKADSYSEWVARSPKVVNKERILKGRVIGGDV